MSILVFIGSSYRSSGCHPRCTRQRIQPEREKRKGGRVGKLKGNMTEADMEEMEVFFFEGRGEGRGPTTRIQQVYKGERDMGLCSGEP